MISYIAVLLYISVHCFGNEILVELDQGKLSGKSGIDRKGNAFYSFLAVPYAKPPIGNLRFSAPQEPEQWEGTLEATTDLPPCSQVVLSKIVGQEDCLYLNVHTPKLPHETVEENLKSVIVFIHGGAFIEGSGSTEYYGAEFLMPAEVVLVTINYRLGLFGFLNSEDDSLEVYGNAGLKDQNMALRWVQKNIRKFGGDPNSVTVIGESAGGASVHFQMLSPLNKGLLHRVVSMSGTAGNSWSHGKTGTLEELQKRLNLNGPDKNENLAKLRELPFEDILNNQRQNGFVIPVHEKFDSSPIVEKEHPGAFITMKSLDAITSGKYNKVPYMLGYTDKDGLAMEIIYRLYNHKPHIIDDFTPYIPSDLNFTQNEADEFKQKLKTFYFGNEEPSVKNLDNCTDLSTDVWFLSGIINTLKAHMHHPENPVFLYRFSGDTGLNYFKQLTAETALVKGAAHIDDLGYLFKTIKTPEITSGSNEDIIIDNIVGLFTSFAKHGIPKANNVEWLPVVKEKLNYLNIDAALTAGVDPDKERFYFWKDVYDKYGPVKSSPQ